MGSQTQFMKGVLELCVLKIISKEPTYGYAILTELQKSSYSDWQQVCELVSTVFQKGAPYE